MLLLSNKSSQNTTMSIINIVHHDENIYNVVPKEKIAAHRPPRYHSKFESMVRHERKVILDNHRTMGQAEVPLHCPQHFLRKDCGVRCILPPSPKKCLSARCKPPVPRRKDLCRDVTEGDVCAKNFRVENIKRVTSAAPRCPVPKYCDTRRGDFHTLVPSGLVPIYVCQPKFGKCPKYIVKRREQRVKDEEKARKEAIKNQPKCRFITAEEREKLLSVSDFFFNF